MPFSRQVFSGFPFDRDDFSGRSTHFRSRLDDLAQRHPEFAEHLQDFPFRSRLNQHRTPTTDFYSRFGEHFPFEDRFDQPQQQQFHPQQQQQQQQSAEKTKEKSQEVPKEEEKQQQQQRGRKVQQSNTVDLGQKQQQSADLVNDRQQRSMSAPPPENRRFVNSINIQLNQPNEQQQQQQPSGSEEMGQSKSTKPQERVIPILVEGRDEPVLPKTYTQQQQPPQQQQQQSERIFGQRPEQFTKFVPKRNIDEDLWRQQQEYKRQQEEKFHQQQQQQKQQQQQQEEPPQQPPKPKTPIDQIKDIQKNVNELMSQVEQFNGKPKDKQCLYLDEMLTQNLIKLDNIDTQGQEIIRTARKEAIKCIEKCLAVLEAKAAANVQLTAPVVVANEEKMETADAPKDDQKDVPSQAEGEEKMEVVVAEENKNNEEKQQTEKMETEPQQTNVDENKDETKTSESQISAEEQEKKNTKKKSPETN